MDSQSDALYLEVGHLRQEVALLKGEVERQRQLLHELRASETKYRLLAEQASDGILILQGGRIRYANDVLARWWGSSVEEIVGQRFTKYVHPDDFFPLLKRYRQKRRGEIRDTSYETRLLRKDGSSFFAELNLSHILYNEKPADLVFIRDITARKQAEQALRQREAILRAVSFIAESLLAGLNWEQDIQEALEQLGKAADVSRVYIFENSRSPEGKWLTSQRYEWCAPGIQPQIDNPELIALSLEDAGFERWVEDLSVGKPVIGLVKDMPPIERDFLAKQDILSIAVVPIMSAGRWWGFIGFDECRYERQWSNAEIDILQIAGRVFGAALERQEYEQTLAQSEARYRALFDQNQDAVLLFDFQGRCIDFNPQATRMLEYSPEEFARLTWSDLILAPEQYRHLDQVWQVNELLLEECLVRRKKRSVFDAEVRTEVVRDQHGQPKRLQCTIRDIRARKRRERELEAEAMLTQLVGLQLDLRSLLEKLLEIARYAIPAADKGSILFVQPDGSLRVEAVSGYSDERIYHLVFEPNQGYVMQCIRERRPVYIPNVREHKEWRYDGEVTEAATVQSAIIAPLVIQEQVIGAISLDSEQLDAFDRDDLASLNNFATSAVLLIHNARLFENLEKQTQEMASLLDASLALNSLDLRTTLQTIGQLAKTIFRADGCRIFLLEPESQTLRCELALQENEQAFSTLRVKVGEGVTGFVALTGVAEIVNDMTNDPRAVHVPGTPEEPEAMMFAPLIYGETSIGVLSVRRVGRNRPFTEENLRLLKAFASLAASAVANSNLFEQTNRRAERLSLLYRVSQKLSHLLDYREIGKMILPEIEQATGWERGSIWLLEKDGSISLLHHQFPGLSGAAYRKEFQRVASLVTRPGQGIVGWVIQHGVPVRCSNVLEDPRYVAADASVRSELCVPLKSERGTFGCLNFESSHENAFTEEDEQTLSTLAGEIAVAIERARLYEETQRRLRHLSALHSIDTAINSTVDLRITLQVILTHVVKELGVDAAAIALLRSQARLLEYVADLGFHFEGLTNVRLYPNEGFVWQAVLQRKMVGLDMTLTPDLDLFRREKFVVQYAVPLVVKGEVRGVLQLFSRKPLQILDDWKEFLNMLASQTAVAIDNASLYENLQRSNLELMLAYDATIEGWSRVLDLRDRETEGHTQRVTNLTVRLARALGIPEEQIVHIRRGALLHDIGKMGVPDRILFKEGKLTEEEWEIMRKHPLFAYQMLYPIEYLRPALDIPYCHHEKWDGTGYPRGLKGEEIPLAARLFAVADVYDALTSNRPYRQAWPHEQVVAYLREQAGKHFDPQIVEVFLRLIEEKQ